MKRTILDPNADSAPEALEKLETAILVDRARIRRDEVVGSVLLLVVLILAIVT